MAAGGREGRGGGRGGCGPRGFAGRGAAPEGSPPHRAAALGLSAAPGVGQGSAFPPSLPFSLPAAPPWLRAAAAAGRHFARPAVGPCRSGRRHMAEGAAGLLAGLEGRESLFLRARRASGGLGR